MCGIGLAVGRDPARGAATIAPYVAARGPHQHGIVIDRRFRIAGPGAVPTGDALDALTATALNSVLLHSRLATSSYAIRPNDAQPIIRGPIIVAHNGVVPDWHGPTPDYTTTVDSEAIAIALEHATLADALASLRIDTTPHAVIAYSPADGGWVAHRNRLPLYASRQDGTLTIASRHPNGATIPEHTTTRLEAP